MPLEKKPISRGEDRLDRGGRGSLSLFFEKESNVGEKEG